MIVLMWLFYATIVFYSVVDAIQTKMLLSMGATELNPILNWLIAKTGTVDSIFVFKGFFLLVLFVCLILKTKEGVK